MKTTLLLGALVLALAAACSSASSPESSDSGATCPPTPSFTCSNPKSPPSFTSDVVPIIQARCTPCHVAGGISDKIYDFSTYAHVVNAQTSILNQLSLCAMPPIHGNTMYGIEPGTVPGLSADQANTFVDWIECGAPNN
jgi:hypothetical protein